MKEEHQEMEEEITVLGSQKPLPKPLSYGVFQFFSAGFKFSGKMNLQPHSSVVRGFSERRESFRTS